MCKCLDKIREKLEAHHGQGSDISFELKMTVNMKTMATASALPPLYYSHRIKNAKGEFTATRKKSYVTFNFCPFCGKKK